jgi:RNA polymerase sigma-70 factor (ECF subfamily)
MERIGPETNRSSNPQSNGWMEVSDVDAVALAKAGDRDGFRILVERHSRSVFRLAFRMTANEQDAEDVVQETFLRAYRQLASYESRSSFGTWLYRIAANYSLDLVRSRRRHEDQHVSGGSGDDDPILRIPAGSPQPDRLAMSGEVGARVQAALGGLTARERMAFVLRHFEGQSIEEIGSALGLNVNATKNSIFRAVQKLRRELEPLVSPVR